MQKENEEEGKKDGRQLSLGERLLPVYEHRLDSSLILAICSEYDDDDHEDPAQSSNAEQQARSTLDALSEAAAATTTTLDEEAASASQAWDNADASSTTMTSVSDAAAGSTKDQTSSAAATTDEDEHDVERAFRDWTLQDDARAITDSNDHGIVHQSYQDYDALSDPISFLKNLFPKRQRVELDLALQDAHGDVETAIEELLTEDFLLREEEQEYLRSLAAGSSDYDEDGVSSSRGSGKGRQRQRHRKPGKQTVSLTSTPRGLSSRNNGGSLNGASSEHEKKGATAAAAAAIDPLDNVWLKTDSTILYLSTLLSIPPGQLSSMFYQYNNSLPLALSKIMDRTEIQYEQLPDIESKTSEMRTLFPDRPQGTLRRCLSAVEGDLPKAVELVRTLEEIHARDGTPLAHDLLLGLQNSRPKPTALAAVPPPPIVAAAAAAAAAASSSKGNGNKVQSVFERPPSAAECVSLAITLRDKRDDAYRSAARTWQNKNALGNSGVAAYWAEHGRHLDRQAREWELRAARATVDERRRQARSLQSVDLHGLTVSQALTVTNECLNAWWHSPNGPMTLTIVTGAGRHSANQNPVILPAVKKLLQREGYDWRFEGEAVHRGSITVTGLQGRRKNVAY